MKLFLKLVVGLCAFAGVYVIGNYNGYKYGLDYQYTMDSAVVLKKNLEIQLLNETKASLEQQISALNEKVSILETEFIKATESKAGIANTGTQMVKAVENVASNVDEISNTVKETSSSYWNRFTNWSSNTWDASKQWVVNLF